MGDFVTMEGLLLSYAWSARRTVLHVDLIPPLVLRITTRLPLLSTHRKSSPRSNSSEVTVLFLLFVVCRARPCCFTVKARRHSCQYPTESLRAATAPIRLCHVTTSGSRPRPPCRADATRHPQGRFARRCHSAVAKAAAQQTLRRLSFQAAQLCQSHGRQFRLYHLCRDSSRIESTRQGRGSFELYAGGSGQDEDDGQ